jgi:hypothetical protein
LAGSVCLSSLAWVQSTQAAEVILSDGFSQFHAVWYDGLDNNVDPLSPDGINLPGTQWQFVSTGNAELKRISQFTESGATFGTTGTATNGSTNFIHAHGRNLGADTISIASAGSYTKPQSLTVSADICLNLRDSVTAGLGFYAAAPTATNFREGFSGLALKTDGSLTLYENGTAGAAIAYSGSWPTVTTGDPVGSDQGPDSGWHTLSYSVDTVTGAISNVSLSGSSSTYNWTTSAFSDAATNLVTNVALLQDGSYPDHFAAFDNFSVAAVPEPAMIGLLGLAGCIVAMRRKARA